VFSFENHFISFYAFFLGWGVLGIQHQWGLLWVVYFSFPVWHVYIHALEPGASAQRREWGFHSFNIQTDTNCERS